MLEAGRKREGRREEVVWDLTPARENSRGLGLLD